MTNIKIKAKGMHCTSCEMLVKDALEEIDGVNNVEASYKNGLVLVDFDEKKINKDKITQIIKQEGFKVE